MTSRKDLKFRHAVETDSEQIKELYFFLTKDEHVSVLPERIKLISEHPENFLFVVELEQEVVGTCFITFCLDPMYATQDYAVLENIVVSDQVRGKGVGKFLMQEVEHFCFSKDCTKLMFLSSSKRSDAHQFFEAMGYSKDIKKGFVKYRSDAALRSDDAELFFC